MSDQVAQPRTFGESAFNALWIFQGVIALPIFFILGFMSLFNMLSTYETLYEFITHFTCAIFSAGILFSVYLQKTMTAAPWRATLRFEILKSCLATASWLWLLMDAIFGPRSHYYYDRTVRIKVAAISAVLPL